MNNKCIVLVAFFFCGLASHAQKTAKTSSIKPASIYTFSSLSTSSNNFSALNKKLNLTNNTFVFVDLIDLDLNQFSVNFNDIGKTPTAFIHDDYIKYRDENLLKGFLLKNDPTRWDLQCPNPLSVQPTE